MPTGGGGGGGGLSTVSVSARLTGNGTAGSPLDLAGQPQNFFSIGAQSGGSTIAGANAIAIWSFVLPYALTFSRLQFNISTADNVNNSDAGIYTAAGVLVANAGAQHMGTTGLQTFTMTQGSQTIGAGKYVFAFTSVGTTFTYSFSNAPIGWVQANNYASSSGGALPASLTAFTQSPVQFSPCIALF